MFAPEVPALRRVLPISSVALPENPALKMPPPTLSAKLLLSVLAITVSVALPELEPSLKMPPPALPAELPLRVLLMISKVALPPDSPKL